MKLFRGPAILILYNIVCCIKAGQWTEISSVSSQDLVLAIFSSLTPTVLIQQLELLKSTNKTESREQEVQVMRQ